MNNDELAALLDRYVNGTCTPEEIEIINSWYDKYQNDPGFTETLTQAERDFLKLKIAARLDHLLREEEEEDENVIPLEPQKTKILSWQVISAAAVALILINFFLSNHKGNDFRENVTSLHMQVANNTQAIMKEVLPDSSTVWLSPHSRIDYSAPFQGKTRNISMTGECFFEVTKDAAHPFIVNSNHMITKVWGTSFRVKDAGDATSASVTVVTGKVSVSKKTGVMIAASKIKMTEVMLHPTEAAVYRANADTLYTETHADMSTLNIWKHVDLKFDNASLTDIVTELNKRFNADIQIRDEQLKNAVMDADLTDLNLPDVLEVLKASLRLEYEIRNNTILLSKKTNKPN